MLRFAARIQMHSALPLHNVPATLGRTEQLCCIVQGKLTEDKERRRIASANAAPDVTPTCRIRAEEDAAAAAFLGP